MVCISYSSSVVNGGLRDLHLLGDCASYDDMEEDNGLDGLDGDDLAEDGMYTQIRNFQIPSLTLGNVGI